MNKYKTHDCSSLRENDIGNDVVISGWLHRKRDHGNLLFVDQRSFWIDTMCVRKQK